MTLSFPSGAGGNWLRKVILSHAIVDNSLNFHYDYNGSIISYNHSIHPFDFDYLYSGNYYFNFYVNVLVKHFIAELDSFNTNNYEKTFLECIDTARHICTFDVLKHLIFFNFDDLLNNPSHFVKQINQIQQQLKISLVKEEEFLVYRTRFFNTCVNTTTVYENFDNMIWVAFVIGQLMEIDCTPDDFAISDYRNQELCKEFAKTHYGLCKLTNVHHFDTNVYLPDLGNK
jgi:hypothetical protein